MLEQGGGSVHQILQKFFIQIDLLLMLAIGIYTAPTKIDDGQVLINDSKVNISFASIPSVVEGEVATFLGLGWFVADFYF